jgi:hypothetical protein
MDTQAPLVGFATRTKGRRLAESQLWLDRQLLVYLPEVQAFLVELLLEALLDSQPIGRSAVLESMLQKRTPATLLNMALMGRSQVY